MHTALDSPTTHYTDRHNDRYKNLCSKIKKKFFLFFSKIQIFVIAFLWYEL